MNEIMRQIKDRKSTRVFEDKEISLEIKNEIVEASIQAPTAGNQALYSIIDVKSQKTKDILAKSCDNQDFIAKAPLVLVYLADCKKYLDFYVAAGINPRLAGEGDLFIAIQDAMIAAQNAVVAAESFSIGSCYIGDILENYELVKETLHLPDYVLPITLLVFGYPTEQQKNRKKPSRFDKKYIVHEDEYKRFDEKEILEMFEQRHVDNDEFNYKNFIEAFYKRKYASDFALEMTRSVRLYLNEYKNLDLNNSNTKKYKDK